MQQVAAEILLHVQLFVIGQHRGKFVHVHQDFALGIRDDLAGGIAIGQALDGRPVRAFRDFLDGEVIFIARHEIEFGAGGHAFHRLDRDLGADEADLGGGIEGADKARALAVGLEAGRGGVDDDQLMGLHIVFDVLE